MSNIVRARLVADGSVTALCSSRIYIIQLQQNCALPAVSLVPLGESPQNAIGGESSLRNENWQIDCWSDNYGQCETLADTVETRMAASRVDFSAVRTDREASFENSTGLYRISLDYSLWI